MAKNYELGKDYYLPVTVHKDGSEDDVKFPIGIKYNDGNKEMTDYIMDAPGLLLTASEVASKFRYRRNIEQEERLEELEKENRELEGKNDELETTVSELSVLVNNLRKEIAQREEGWDNVSRNNDIAVYNLNRLCKQREVLTDRIIALEAELEAEREKNNG
jgi:septal ring factor EnvC (AmiA/AmiB activator)